MLWWQGRARSSHQSTPGWPFKGNCWIEGIGADYRVSKTDERVFLAETAKEMDVISQNVSMDWVCVYCPETGEQVLLMTMTTPVHVCGQAVFAGSPLTKKSRAPWGLALIALNSPRLPATHLNLQTGAQLTARMQLSGASRRLGGPGGATRGHGSLPLAPFPEEQTEEEHSGVGKDRCPGQA